ncbi:MAG: glycosyltransferase family 2 protein, partial [Dermatophilaceae bacterium]
MYPPPVVVALVVSHNGARWLPQVVTGIEAQHRKPDRVLVVDTGSTDNSREITTAAWGGPALIELPSSASFPVAIRAGANLVPEADWIWILHDDSTPEPRALEQLLAYVSDHPDVHIAGPKLREWPSLRRLVEIGVTISATGRRETGL